jgi:hypothetical protein
MLLSTWGDIFQRMSHKQREPIYPSWMDQGDPEDFWLALVVVAAFFAAAIGVWYWRSRNNGRSNSSL